MPVTSPTDRLGEIAHGGGVEDFGEVGVILSLVDVGVGGTVDDDVYIVVLRHFFNQTCGRRANRGQSPAIFHSPRLRPRLCRVERHRRVPVQM